MNEIDHFKKVLDTIKEDFTYLPVNSPNIVGVLRCIKIATYIRRDLVTDIYPTLEELDSSFNKDKYEEAYKEFHFKRLELTYDKHEDFDKMLHGYQDYFNIIGSRQESLSNYFDNNTEECKKDYAFMLDYLDVSYNSLRVIRTYLFNLVAYQIMLDKGYDINVFHDDMQLNTDCVMPIIEYMFKRTFKLYRTDEILYDRELTDNFIRDFYAKETEEVRLKMKELLSFSLKKNYINEEIHNDIMDIFQNADSEVGNTVFN